MLNISNKMLITSTNTKVYKLNFNLNTTNHLIQPLPTHTLCTLATCIWCNFISAFVIEWKSTGNCINLKRLKLKKNIGTSRSKEFNISMMPTKSYQCYANPNYRFLTFSSNCCSSGNIPLNYETISDKLNALKAHSSWKSIDLAILLNLSLIVFKIGTGSSVQFFQFLKNNKSSQITINYWPLLISHCVFHSLPSRPKL